MAGMLTGCGSTGDSTGAGESTSGGETASEEGTGADAAEDAAAAESADTGSADASGESVEVTFWTLNGRMDAIDPLTEEFNAAHDNIKVTVAYYDTDGTGSVELIQCRGHCDIILLEDILPVVDTKHIVTCGITAELTAQSTEIQCGCAGTVV